MAGAGFKTFNTGDVLLASEVNTYLMQQTVMVFDDATARTSALGANVAEGMFSYLKDTNLTYRYDGSAWLSDAGTTSPLTTKGDLWTYSTTDARLPVGTDGYTLVADSSTSTGLKWAAAAGGGKVLQVVSATTNTQVANSTNTYTDTGLTASITPSANTSKILVIVAQNGCFKGNGNNGNRVDIQLLRGATSLTSIGDHLWTDSAIYNIGSTSIVHLDSPSTTSSTTYKTQLRNPANAAEIRVQSGGISTSSITLLEIGA